MAEMTIVAPTKTVTVSFSLEPAYNAIGSLMLLGEAEEASGFADWVYETNAALSAEQKRTNELILHNLPTTELVCGQGWDSFSAWVDHLAAYDPAEMRDEMIRRFRDQAARVLDGEIPSIEGLLADQSAYLAVVDRVHTHFNKPCDLSKWEEAHALLQDPVKMQDTIVSQLRRMWEQVLADEWERTVEMLQESVTAFETLNLDNLSLTEALRRVAERDLPAEWEQHEPDIEHVVFIPSAHIGPYVLLAEHGSGTAHIIYGARIPAGASTRSSTLDRSELLMRLNALADDTRLRIIKLVTQLGEAGSQDIMTQLELSQSAASRHLHQLSATGYLTVRRHEGAKLYRVNTSRIEDTFKALKSFCCP